MKGVSAVDASASAGLRRVLKDFKQSPLHANMGNHDKEADLDSTV